MINVSDRPSEDENTLQVGLLASGSYQNWFVVWNHIDDHAFHRIGICRAMAAISSSTRTVGRYPIKTYSSARRLGPWRTSTRSS